MEGVTLWKGKPDPGYAKSLNKKVYIYTGLIAACLVAAFMAFVLPANIIAAIVLSVLTIGVTIGAAAFLNMRRVSRFTDMEFFVTEDSVNAYLNVNGVKEQIAYMKYADIASVKNGKDRYCDKRGLGIVTITFKRLLPSGSYKFKLSAISQSDEVCRLIRSKIRQKK
jgi:hypothetical protein